MAGAAAGYGAVRINIPYNSAGRSVLYCFTAAAAPIEPAFGFRRAMLRVTEHRAAVSSRPFASKDGIYPMRSNFGA